MIEFAPINVFDATNFAYADFGMTGGILLSDGNVMIWDHAPTDSFLRWGKVGYSRLGFCHFLEARVDFRTFSSPTIHLDYSLDGRYIEPYMRDTLEVSHDPSGIVFPNKRARWMTITVAGKYDVSYMEARANISGRR
jgi:hypothetical protein